MNQGSPYFFTLRFLTPLARAVFPVRYSGTENIPESGKLIVCRNHKSVFDPLLLAMPFRRQIRYMAKQELFTDHGPAASWFFKTMGAFPVKRNTADCFAVRTADEILEGGGVVGIFPQGGCVFGNEPFRPKPGVALLAARTGAPVLPAAICCDGVLRPFRRICVRFGRAIASEDLPIHGTSVSGMRDAARKIAGEINALLEVKH